VIVYKKCTDVDIDDIFRGFQVGFSDYIIKLEMDRDFFINRFFGPEGNSLEHSFAAFDGDVPVGVILGGIKEYEGIMTMRCGALCVHPDYRGTGVSRELFRLHKQTALDNGCKQLFLEVIAGNDRAINFYKGLGYEKIYDLSYFIHNNPVEIQKLSIPSYPIRQAGLYEIMGLKAEIAEVHMNWQNDFDYMAKLPEQLCLAMNYGGRIAAAISINAGGRISFLWVRPGFRGKRIATSLIGSAVSILRPQRLYMSFPNNAGLQGFAKKLGFEKDSISQYEMYLTL